MTEAQRAAFRILESTPRDNVHTHHWRPPIENKGGRWAIEHTLWLNRRVLELKGKGWTQTQIAIELCVSKVTVSRHCCGNVRALHNNKKRHP